MSEATKRTAGRSFLFKLAESTGTQGISFLVGIVLARLLDPTDYAVLTLLTVFISLSRVFVQSGLNTALVQRLAREPGAHEVRLASPATRGAGAAKETFIIELKLEAGRYGPVQVGEGAAS